jgi:hypothetical protein
MLKIGHPAFLAVGKVVKLSTSPAKEILVLGSDASI